MVDAVVLKLLIESNEEVISNIDRVNAEDFTYPGNHVFHAIVDIVEQGGKVSLTLLNSKLPQLVEYLSEVTSIEVGEETVESLLPTLKENSLRKRIKMMAGHLLSRVDDKTIKVESLIDTVQSASLDLLDGGTEGNMEDFSDVVMRLDFDSPPISGVGDRYGFGLPQVDELLGGFENRSLNVLAGNSGTGKSEMMRQILYSNLKRGKHCMVFTIEETSEEFGIKYISHDTGISPTKLDKKRLSVGEVNRAKRSQKEIFKACKNNFRIVDKGITGIPYMFKQIKKYKYERKVIPLVILDHMHIMGEQTVEALTKLTRGFKMLTENTDVPLLILSQTNRGMDNREDKVPLLSDLKGSGSIEQDATRVMFLVSDTNDESPERLTRLYVKKQRNGMTGVIDLVNLRAKQRFVEK